MKLFIRRIVLFTLFLFIVILLLQIIITFRINIDSRKYGILEQSSAANADLVLLGSSRCWSHLQPGFFNKTFSVKTINIGTNGHSEIAMAIIRLKYYLSKNKVPKFAILSFDPFTRAGSETKNSFFFLKNNYAQYAFFPNKKDLLILNYFGFNFFEKYIPLYAVFKYRLLSINFLTAKNVSSHMKYTYEFNKEKWDTLEHPVNKTKKLFFQGNEKQEVINSLNMLKKLCDKYNIKLLCLQTPVYKNIYDEKAFSTTDTICSVLNIPFINAERKNIRENIGFFYNSNHLNKKGIEQMNLILKNDTLLNSFLKN